MTTRFLSRFWSKVRKSSGCWTWTSTLNRGGYGHFFITQADAKQLGLVFSHPTPQARAHVVAWTLHTGAPPKDLVLHKCNNPACVRPSHLYDGSQLQNMRDRDRVGRRVAPKGEAHGRAKLTAASVKSIRRAFAAHATLASLSRRYGVSATQIRRVVNRISWT